MTSTSASIKQLSRTTGEACTYCQLMHQLTAMLSDPAAWYHFAGDAAGTAFKALIYLPSKLDEKFWTQPTAINNDIRLMVKKVFITSDLGENFLPKWTNYIKVIVDADDLPLNVSRETLQSTRFLKQIKSILVRRLIQLFVKLAKEDQEKFQELQKNFGATLKLGAVEDSRNREKIVELVQYATNQRNATTLNDYIKNKKGGQKQIFFLADMGKSAEQLAQSVFVEKLTARGYEVLLLSEPLDEILIQTLRSWKNFQFQDVAKAGLQFGDEGERRIALFLNHVQCSMECPFRHRLSVREGVPRVCKGEVQTSHRLRQDRGEQRRS
jgi:heat shock protein 90kDa beta